MTATLKQGATIEEQLRFVGGLPEGTEVMFLVGDGLVVEKAGDVLPKCYLGGRAIGELTGYAADHVLYGGDWYCVTIGIG